MKLCIHSQTSTVPPLTFGDGQAISSHTLWACGYLSMLGLKLIHFSERDPGISPDNRFHSCCVEPEIFISALSIWQHLMSSVTVKALLHWHCYCIRPKWSATQNAKLSYPPAKSLVIWQFCTQRSILCDHVWSAQLQALQQHHLSVMASQITGNSTVCSEVQETSNENIKLRIAGPLWRKWHRWIPLTNGQ